MGSQLPPQSAVITACEALGLSPAAAASRRRQFRAKSSASPIARYVGVCQQ